MSRKLLLSSMAVLLLQGGIALASPGGREERPVERERGLAGRTWVWNLGDKSAGLVVAAPPGGYAASYNYTTATLSRVDRWRVNWTTSFPSLGAHVSGHQYRWSTCITDGGCSTCATHNFTAL